MIVRIIYSNLLFSAMFFFSFLAIFGLNYSGLESSSSLLIYSVFSSILAYGLILIGIFRDKGKILLKDLVFYLIPIPIILSYLWTGNFSGLAYKTIGLFLLSVVPGIYLAIEISKKDGLKNYENIFLALAVVITLGILRTIPEVLNSPVYEVITLYAGGHYQNMSYFSSLAFIITLTYFSFYSPKKSILFALFLLTMMLIQIGGVLASGGRGGLVVIFVTIVSILFLRLKFIKTMLLFVGLVFIVPLILNSLPLEYLIDNQLVIDRLERLVSYISSDGLDFSQSSFRDVFYIQSLEYISQKPIFGHGFFSIIDNSPEPFFERPGDFYSHNFFLDILLHGGILFLLFWIAILSVFFYKIFLILKYEKDQFMILVPVIYSFTQLMFSGSYLQETMFWFSVVFVLSYNFQRESSK
tara:strand:+ start:3984 stop:5219 length:1236 start_codon:yes stop_codon:yes gene_type:complete